MRNARLALLVAALLLAVLPAPGAGAAAIGFTGRLALELATLDPIEIAGAGVATVGRATPGGPLTALALPAGAFAANGLVVPVTDPLAAPISGVRLTVANDAGAFTGMGGTGSFGGPLPLAGVAKVCLFAPCSAAIGNIEIPLSVVGGGGSVAVSAAVNVTVIGAPWTTKTAAIGALTRMGGMGPASATTAVSLVTPIYIVTNLGADNIVPGFATLHLAIPEPGTLALLGAGAAGLVAYGRRVRRRARA